MVEANSTAPVAAGANGAPNWCKVVDEAGWRPRDSQGELVHSDRMWILGGWFSNEDPCPRDVWSSRDGTGWEQTSEVAPWKHGDLPMTLSFQNRMWFMGGWCDGLLPGGSASSEVWWSDDGVHTNT